MPDKCGICDFPLPPTVLECPNCHADLTAVGVERGTASLDPDIFLNRTEDEPLLQHYAMLHDGLSDMIEGGRLTEEMIPDDYQWLVRMLVNAETIRNKEEEPEGLVTLKLGDTGKTLTFEIDPNGGAIVRRDD